MASLTAHQVKKAKKKERRNKKKMSSVKKVEIKIKNTEDHVQSAMFGKADKLKDQAALTAEKLKKKKKKKTKPVAAAAAAAMESDTIHMETAENKEERRKKKKKQKKRKAQDEDTTTRVPGKESTVLEKTLKKKKKKKNAENGGKITDVETSSAKDMALKTKVQPHIAPSSPSKKRKLSISSDLPPEVVTWRGENSIKLIGEDVPALPFKSFQEANFPKQVLGGCESFTNPTPIQAQCWPILRQQRDLIGVAETGSGKTLAFALPALAHIVEEGITVSCKTPGPLMLVIAPTRELALQCSKVIGDCIRSANMRSCCVYGGVPKHEQKRQLHNSQGGAHVVVATPGRLKDLLQEGALSLDRVRYLVLDEADRMLDLGFEEDMRTIIGQTPRTRQTAMFSATWPKEVRELAMEFLNNPIRVTIGGSKLAANSRVSQTVEVVNERERLSKLRELLKRYHTGSNRIIIFGLYKKECARLESDLQWDGWNCGAIHGDKSQEARETTLGKFKENKVPLLIATDVAARGLDIPDVEVVINYSFPLTIEDYVHRIGRTGRAGKSGISHTFFHDGDKARAGELVNVLKKADAQIPPELLKYGTHVKKKEHKLYGAFSKDVDMSKTGTRIVFDDSSDEEN
mmetsp:Transcript_1748/g.2216  ORF Transcript_1748/g.2216 Transcript_1748/m.2216 type:complete len:630 (+) Transcript_1748:191-2080(+)